MIFFDLEVEYKIFKKKWFKGILIILTIWALISLYFYNQHVVTVKTCNINEHIELGGIKMAIDDIRIYNYEMNRKNTKYNKYRRKIEEYIVERIPKKFLMKYFKISYFYSKPYKFLKDSTVIKLRGRVLLDSINEISEYDGILPNNIKFKIIDDMDYDFYYEEDDGIKTYQLSGTSAGNENIIHFELDGKILSEIDEENIKKLLIKDEETNKEYIISLEEPFIKKHYNYFLPKPKKDDNNPTDIIRSFLRKFKNNNIDEAKKYILKDSLENFKWESLNVFSKKEMDIQRSFFKYEGRYLDYQNVYSLEVTFSNEESSYYLIQTFYLINKKGKWYIINVEKIK